MVSLLGMVTWQADARSPEGKVFSKIRKENGMATIKKINFLPMAPEELEKLKQFLKTTSEFMDVDIRTVEVTSVQVLVDADRPDVVTIVNKVALSENRKRKEPRTGTGAG